MEKLIDTMKSMKKEVYSPGDDSETYLNRLEFPEDLYNLDILDGSPPCSSFSMAGNREKDWGKTKVFREGQAEQRLDDLFFDYIVHTHKITTLKRLSQSI